MLLLVCGSTTMADKPLLQIPQISLASMGTLTSYILFHVNLSESDPTSHVTLWSADPQGTTRAYPVKAANPLRRLTGSTIARSGVGRRRRCRCQRGRRAAKERGR